MKLSYKYFEVWSNSHLLVINPHKCYTNSTIIFKSKMNLNKELEMGIKSDRWIREKTIKENMIVPFTETQIDTSVISFGLSSYGYDLSLSNKFKIFTNVFETIIDPKNFSEDIFIDIQTEVCIIPPNSMVLGRSIEYLRIPRNVITLCIGKSTYARCGIFVNVTPFEPEWNGYVTMEISNLTSLPVKIYANEGIAQILFFEGDDECITSYADRKGKYQGQKTIVLPKIK